MKAEKHVIRTGLILSLLFIQCGIKNSTINHHNLLSSWSIPRCYCSFSFLASCRSLRCPVLDSIHIMNSISLNFVLISKTKSKKKRVFWVLYLLYFSNAKQLDSCNMHYVLLMIFLICFKLNQFKIVAVLLWCILILLIMSLYVNQFFQYCNSR